VEKSAGEVLVAAALDATPREAGTLGKFAENYLRRDGMFIVRLIGLNMGEVVASERSSSAVM